MSTKSKKAALEATAAADLLQVLEARFATNKQRHAGISWADVRQRLDKQPDRLWSLHQMEASGGEPDVVGSSDVGGFLFMDCSAETPAGRRSLCYDRAALDKRKGNKPAGNAQEAAAAMGISLLTEQQYFYLQTLGRFDLKTSSWLHTPDDLRKLGGALFGDRRYGRVFIYHNGAESYYAARGWRGVLKV